MKIRLFVSFWVACLVCCLCACNGSDDSSFDNSNLDGDSVAVANSKTLDNGTCGDNVMWTLDADGTLVISGTGPMNGYYGGVPWRTYQEQGLVTAAVIQDGVTVIGNFVFMECTGLVDVTIPSSVTRIGHYAFRSCTGLTDVIIPDSVTYIEEFTFAGCTSLTNIAIPSDVTEIDQYAFAGCTSLTNVTIPSNVTRIGSAAFSGCSNLKDVYYSGSETDWTAISIDDGNEELTNATIHYNSTEPNTAVLS